MDQYLSFAKNIALKAGEIMRHYFTEDHISSYKNDQTIVTKADTEINQYLISEVKKHFPTHSVDGEEEQFTQNQQNSESHYTWVCDPLDGTAMYARHLPVAVFSLALVRDGVPLVGVIYDPFTDTLYHASKNSGAYKNGRQIHVSDIKLSDKRSVAHYDMWPGAPYNLYNAIEELGQQTYLVSIGSVAHACALVASGDFNLVIFPGTTHKNCDIAAAKIIVEEAGGKVTDLFGHEQLYNQSLNGALVSNGTVHAQALQILAKHLASH